MGNNIKFVKKQKSDIHRLYLDNVCPNKCNVIYLIDPSSDTIKKCIEMNEQNIMRLTFPSSDIREFAIKSYPHLIFKLNNVSDEEIRLAIEMDNRMVIALPTASQEQIDDVIKNHLELLKLVNLYDKKYYKIVLAASKFNIIYFWRFGNIHNNLYNDLVDIYPELQQYISPIMSFSNSYKKWKMENLSKFEQLNKL